MFRRLPVQDGRSRNEIAGSDFNLYTPHHEFGHVPAFPARSRSRIPAAAL